MMFNVFINSWYAYKHLDLSKQKSNKLASPYYVDVMLNGLEIMKIRNSKGFLGADDESPKSSSKVKTGLLVGIVVGVVLIYVILASAFFLVIRKRKWAYLEANCNKINGVSKFGYHFSLASIQRATDNFNDNLVIGVGGFGKVYKGVLEDDKEVAIKRVKVQVSSSRNK